MTWETHAHARQELAIRKNHKEVPWLDLGLYAKNRRRFPLDQLIPYRGKYVAWSIDGTRILASGRSRKEVDKRLRAAGIDPGQVVGDYIDPGDEARL